MFMKIHYYFFLGSSPWAFISSLSVLNFFFSFFLFFNYYFLFILPVSLIHLLIISFFWWRDFSREFIVGMSSDFLDFVLKFSMIMFISSEVFFFFSFFWSYFHFFLSPSFELGLSWPPFLVTTFNSFGMPLLNSLLLLSSGVTITISHFFMMGVKDDFINFSYYKSLIFLMFTIFFGLLFTICQVKEYYSSWFCISDSTFGSVVYVLTGFHGLHVIVGSVFLIISFIRLMMFFSTMEHMTGFELCAWYWHFVDVVWLFLYVVIYVML